MKQAAAAAEARKQAAAQKRAEALANAEAKKKKAEEKRKADQQKKTVEKALGTANSGATLSLGFFNFGQKSEDGESERAADNASSPPRGVPVLSKWRQNNDGSITGMISGSNAYKDGESVTTSVITTKAEGGTVVKTKSGSRYYLAAKATGGGFFGIGAPKTPVAATDKAQSDLESKRKAQQEAAAKKREEAEAAVQERKRIAEEKRRQAEEKKRLAIEAAVAKRKEAAEKSARLLEQQSKSSGGKRSQTFSLGFLNFASDTGGSLAGKVTSTAPRGTPTLSRWRKNGDGSISGTITGAPGFKNGEFITTSPITGNAVDGTVVTTKSGSRYVFS